MPFPANWLEELVIEWLDLEGFVISTSVIVPVKQGGRFMPDVVGARVDRNGQRLLIRHCEAAMVLSKGQVERYANHFNLEIERAVRGRFDNIFGERMSKQAKYEKWLITFRPGADVRDALEKSVQEIRIVALSDFISTEVRPAIKRWREKSPNTETTQVPGDKWLLHLIDRFEHFGLLAGTHETPGFDR